MTLFTFVMKKLVGFFLGGYLFVPLVTFLLVLVIIRLSQFYLYLRTLPPGPWGVPFLGFLPYLSPVPHQQFTQMSKKYGPTFSARLGTQLIVVLSDYKSIKKAFRRDAFSGRPVNDISAIIEGYGEFANSELHFTHGYVASKK
jgi:26-hydroxylase